MFLQSSVCGIIHFRFVEPNERVHLDPLHCHGRPPGAVVQLDPGRPARQRGGRRHRRGGVNTFCNFRDSVQNIHGRIKSTDP